MYDTERDENFLTVDERAALVRCARQFEAVRAEKSAFNKQLLAQMRDGFPTTEGQRLTAQGLMTRTKEAYALFCGQLPGGARYVIDGVLYACARPDEVSRCVLADLPDIGALVPRGGRDAAPG